jgi:lipoprotein LprG
MHRPRLVTLTVTLVLGVAGSALAGCTAKPSMGNPRSTVDLPAGPALLASAATALRDVKSIRFTIETEGTLGELPLRRADGRLTRDGSAKGSMRITQDGGPVEFEFVIIGPKLWLKGPTGGFQQLPLALASTVYDPSTLLDPERGVARVVRTATKARTEAREQVDGVDAYRVAASFDSQAIAAVVPGAGAGATGQLWLDVNSKSPVHAKVTIAPSAGGQPATATVRFTEYNAPVTINAP